MKKKSPKIEYKYYYDGWRQAPWLGLLYIDGHLLGRMNFKSEQAASNGKEKILEEQLVKAVRLLRDVSKKLDELPGVAEYDVHTEHPYTGSLGMD